MKVKQFIFIVTILMMVLVGAQFLNGDKVCGYSHPIKIDTPESSSRGPNERIAWFKTIFEPGAKWIKVHFSKFGLKAGEYVELIDKNGLVKVRIKGSDVADEANSRYKVSRNADKTVNFWGPAIDGDTLRIKVRRTGKIHSGWGFAIDDVGVGSESISGENGIARTNCICGNNDLKDIACYANTTYFDRGQAVGKILFLKDGYWQYGTGFLLSCNNSNHFMTSCRVDSQAIVDTLEVQFQYQYTTCEGSTLSTVYKYYGDQIIAKNSTLDYCLLTLKGSPQSDFTPLQPLSREPNLDENIYIIQHPYGWPKKIDFDPVSSTTSDDDFEFEYYVDTESSPTSSSGSPVLSVAENKVLGIDHRWNCPNKGVKMSAIYNYIKNYVGCD